MTFNDILMYFRDAMRAFSNKKLNFSENSFVYALGQAVASVGLKIYAALNNIETRTSLLTATSSDLDNIFSNFKIQRKLSSPARGSINIYINSSNFSNRTAPTIIYSGESIVDSDGNRYIVTETCVIPTKIQYYPEDISEYLGSKFYAIPLKNSILNYSEDGSISTIKNQFISTIEVNIESINTGVATNVAKGTINTTKGIVTYYNNYPLTGGTDSENDEIFRYRGLSIIRGSNSKFSSESIKGYLLSQPGVLDAKIIENFNCLTFEPPRIGHVYGIINTSLIPIDRDTSAYYPSSSSRNIYQQIRNNIEDDMYRPLGIGITIREADIININFTSSQNESLKIYVKDSVILSSKINEIASAIYNYFLTEVKIGQSIYKSDIYRIIKNDPDVINIDDFDFLYIYGYDSSGNPIYNEVIALEASCNQIFRVKSSDSLSIVLETISTSCEG
jgi:uncharacterized phage protein gp47/JayE